MRGRLVVGLVLLVSGLEASCSDSASPDDTQAPTVSITAPTDGDTVTGAVTVEVTAQDNVGIVSRNVLINGTVFYQCPLDGPPVCSTTSPWSFNWDTDGWQEGSYTLTARAYDAASNTGSSAAVSVTVVHRAGPDFERDLGPGEYQVSVTGDVERSFEATGARVSALGTGLSLDVMGDPDALDGAAFDLCAVPSPPATYGFDAVTPFAGCPLDPGRVAGGFIVQLGAPQEDELDCYPNGYGTKAFDGVLTITSVTGNAIEGEAQGAGTCSRHPHSEIDPMRSAAVSVRIRFRAVREIP